MGFLNTACAQSMQRALFMATDTRFHFLKYPSRCIGVFTVQVPMRIVPVLFALAAVLGIEAADSFSMRIWLDEVSHHNVMVIGVNYRIMSWLIFTINVCSIYFDLGN